jgi:hypothetical protein
MRLSVGGAVTAPDRLRLLPWAQNPSFDTGYSNTDALSPAVMSPSARRLVLAYKGQSNMAGNSFDDYQPTQAGNLMLGMHDGQIYHARNPMLGPSATIGTKACWALRVADELIRRGLADEVVSANVAMNASTAQAWALGAGGLSHRMTVMRNRLAMCGLAPNFVIRHQGESGEVVGYLPALQAEIAFDRAAGFTCPYIVGLDSFTGTATQPVIRIAQQSVVNNVDVFQGVDTDVYGASLRGDTVHFGQAVCIAAALGTADIIEGILLS